MNKVKWLFLIVLIFLPRLALLGNGLDQQRMWDTVVPDIFNLLNAVKEGGVNDFLSENRKYPLLGAYVLSPTVAAYYGLKKITGHYGGPADFIDSFALSKTNIFFWIRAEMLIINLAALLLLYFLVRRFLPESKKAPYYVILIAAANFFAALFSVQPRIHSFAFLGAVGVLYASFLLVERKSWRTYLLAFTASALAASLSQSGVLTIIMPVLAHFYDGSQKKWLWMEKTPYISKKLYFSSALFILVLIGVGYPQIFMALWNGGIGSANMFSPEHTQPEFRLAGFFPFVRKYFFVSEFVAVWCFIGWIIYIFKRNKEKSCLDNPYAIIAASHIFLFFLVFGFVNVATGRFVLAALPSMFFFFGCVISRLDGKKWFMYPLCVAVILQCYGVIMLARIGMGGDTRSLATDYLLRHTSASDKILSSVDHHLLGIIPTASSLRAGHTGTLGRTDNIIMSKELSSDKSRPFIFLDLRGDSLAKLDLSEIKYIVITDEDRKLFYEARSFLHANGFRETKTFLAKQNLDKRDDSTFISWDMIAPAPHIPIFLIIDQFGSMGPNVFLFTNDTYKVTL